MEVNDPPIMDNPNSDAVVPDAHIADVADQVAYFEKATLFFGKSKITLGDELSRHNSSGSFSNLKITTTVRNFRLRDVVLDADTLVLFQGSARIKETSFFVSDDAYESLRVVSDSLIQLDEGEDVIIAHNRVHGAYHHWLMQCVPAIDLSMRQHRNNPARLALPPLQPWQEDMLVLLGYGSTPRLAPKPGTQYLIPNVEYSQFLNGTTSFGICRSSLATAHRLRDRVVPTPPLHDIIYVPCTDPYYGQAVNEDEVIDFLLRRGVYIAPLGRLDTSARINLFRNAKVVIGPHGAGLTDVLFCEPGALVWELMPRHYQNVIFNRQAQVAELDYWGDLFEQVESSSLGEWRIDLDVIADRFGVLSRRLPECPSGDFVSHLNRLAGSA